MGLFAQALNDLGTYVGGRFGGSFRGLVETAEGGAERLASILAAMPFFGFAVVWYGTSSQALIQQHSPAEMRGRMMSLYTLGSMGTTPLGALIVGAVIAVLLLQGLTGAALGAVLAFGLAALATPMHWWFRLASCAV